MKALINKLLILAIASITLLLAAPAARAQFTSQLEEKTIPVGDFSGIEVAGDFEVTLSNGPCVAKVTVDKMLSPYVQVYVRGKVLHITYDSKAVPKDVRQLYKGRNAPKPVFRASITMPELSSLFLAGNAVLNCGDVLECKLTADIDIQDKAQLKNLNLSAGSVNVNMKKQAQAALSIEAVNKVEFRTEGNANLRATVNAHDLVSSAVGSSEIAITSKGENATLSGTGSSKTVVTFEGEKAVVTIGGSASMNLSGKGEALSVRGEKNSNLDAAAFDTKSASVDLNGSVKANVTVSENLDANLVGGSSLYYTGDPAFKIGKVVRSTLAPYGSSSR